MNKRKLIDFSRHVYGYSIAPIFTRLNYYFHRLTGRPYFGWYLSSRQGFPDRHPIMAALAEKEARDLPKGPFQMIEIGSWAGGSAITWGRALERSGKAFELLCIDAWKPYFNLKENSDIHYRKMNRASGGDRIFNLFNWNIRAAGLADAVYPIRGTSRQRLPQLKPKSFQMIYIDGDHSYQGVAFDLAHSAPLLTTGGILCGDDLEAQYSEVDAKYLKKNLHADYLMDPRCGREYHPGITLALHEFFGKDVTVKKGFWAMRWTGKAWKGVDLAS